MGKLAAIVLMLLLAEIAGAQTPTSGNVFFGYSYYNSNLTGGRISLNGWEASMEGKVLPFIGLVGTSAATMARPVAPIARRQAWTAGRSMETFRNTISWPVLACRHR